MSTVAWLLETLEIALEVHHEDYHGFVIGHDETLYHAPAGSIPSVFSPEELREYLADADATYVVSRHDLYEFDELVNND